MASAQARIGQQALALLDVALRVPCIFIIDAIFNSYFDPGSGWARATGMVLVRITGKRLLIPQVKAVSLLTYVNKQHRVVTAKLASYANQQCGSLPPARGKKSDLSASGNLNLRLIC